MGLEHTTIPDNRGAALYVLYDGTVRQQREWQRFIDDLQKRTKHQVVLLSVKDRDGERIRSFYQFQHYQLPVVMIVRDDDQLAHTWHGTERPSIDHVVASLQQIDTIN